jgi:plasmid stabilization system protein ParE
VRIHYRVEAADEVVAARRWYHEQNPNVAAAFQSALYHVEALIADHPTAFPIVHAGFRRVLMRRFPYAVYYRPFGAGDLEIVAVLHERQRWATLGTRG